MKNRLPIALAGAAFGFCLAGTFLHFAYGAQETPSPYNELDRFGQAFAKRDQQIGIAPRAVGWGFVKIVRDRRSLKEQRDDSFSS